MEILKNGNVKLSEQECIDLVLNKELKRIRCDKLRWGTCVISIVKIENKFYGIDWVESATEMQENEIYAGEYHEMEEKEIMIKKWVTKEKIYKYSCSNDDYPKQGLIKIDDKTHIHKILHYNRQMTYNEIKDYEMFDLN